MNRENHLDFRIDAAHLMAVDGNFTKENSTQNDSVITFSPPTGEFFFYQPRQPCLRIVTHPKITNSIRRTNGETGKEEIVLKRRRKIIINDPWNGSRSDIYTKRVYSEMYLKRRYYSLLSTTFHRRWSQFKPPTAIIFFWDFLRQQGFDKYF